MSYTAQEKYSVLHKKHTFLCNTECLLNKTAQSKEVKNRILYLFCKHFVYSLIKANVVHYPLTTLANRTQQT